MITVTDNAASQIQKLLVKQAMAPAERDLVFDGPGGARVWIDPRSHRLLDGTTLDYDTSLLSRGFVLENPHAKSTCGCGTSFSV